MSSIFILILIGFLIGTLGTLIGAGGGFILVPLLILMHPELSAQHIAAISIAVVACNAISGSVAYMRARRVDYRAGIIFAICTIPGSILGVMTTKIIPRNVFDVIFGVLLFGLALFLFLKGGKKQHISKPVGNHKGWYHQSLRDKAGEVHEYSYDVRKGGILSVFVGYFSPLLGIGGGIIHVPVMVEWLRFPVHIATATSHFILAIMATVSVVTNWYEGSYNDPAVTHMMLGLAIGIIPGAQLGAFLSKKLQGRAIIKALALALGVVAIRILWSRFF
ncbi:MAG: sulfite exporter TauE/SafE family protein [Bacteroidetes bacterium]|nr:sulfite exporter TauE/SafE family protein [Bacteroidota bacterium]MBS1628900.1 sulfite exporter TauE/SafE family protein [Bacteroidota bacterium]